MVNDNQNVWILSDTDECSQYYGQGFRFDFSYIKAVPIKRVYKAYIRQCYQTQSKTVCKLYNEILGFKYFCGFAEQKGIRSLRSLCNDDICHFIVYLKTAVLKNTHKPLAYAYQKRCLDVVKNVIRWGQLHMPEEVPQTEIFAGNEYIGTNSKLKIDFIPDEIMARVSSALEDEQNLFMKYGIIILRSTGMRIEDMLRLKAGCLAPHPISGATLTWYNHKNRKQQPPMPIPDECADAVRKLAEHTEHLRTQASPELKELIFLRLRSKGSSAGKVTRIGQSEFRNDMRDFVARHNITDKGGILYLLTPHKFRRTLATDMLSKGTNISVIQSVLGHSSVNSTKMHYADVKDSSRAEAFRSIGIIGNIRTVDESVIPDSAELSWFQENQNGCAKMCDGYCTQPFQRGVLCERLLNRQKCYTCSRYITTPEYLEHHREYLRSLEAQLANNPYGHHYAEHFSGTVAVLKEIIAGLEALKDD